jgi:hypothetical protein
MGVLRETSAAGKRTRSAAILIGFWWLLAPVVLFLLAVFTDVRMFVPRYFCAVLPGQALLLGGLLASIKRRIVRDALCVVVTIMTILSPGGTTHGNENWRDAMTFVRAEAGSAPVLVVSGFVEATDFARVRDPELRDVLFAPELMYGEPARSIRLPSKLPGVASPEMERIAGELRGERRFFLVSNIPDFGYEKWLVDTMRGAGARCKGENAGDRFGWVSVTSYWCG